MAISTTGSLSFSQLRTEFGHSGSVSISDYYGKYYENNTQCPTSGTLKFSNLRGTGAPIAGTWNDYSSWSSWSSCSVSCGGGTQSRSRSRTKNNPRYGGSAATGSTVENGSQACNTQSCGASLNTSFTQCMDSHFELFYDGQGRFYLSSREPNNNTHCCRGDCGGHPQGHRQVFSFNKAGWSTINLTVTISGRNGTWTYNFNNKPINNQFSGSWMGSDTSGGAAGYTVTFSGLAT